MADNSPPGLGTGDLGAGGADSGAITNSLKSAWMQYGGNLSQFVGTLGLPDWTTGGFSPWDGGGFAHAIQTGDWKTVQALIDANPNIKGVLSGWHQKQQVQSGQSPVAALQDFYNRYTAPLDPSDPMVRSVAQSAASTVGTDAAYRGIAGPGVASSATSAAAGALSNLSLQRAQLGVQALTSGTQLGLEKASMDYQAALNASQNSGNTGRTIGSIVGGIGGAVGAYYTGNPALIQAGAQLGGGIGGGIGQATNPPPSSVGWGTGGGY